MQGLRKDVHRLTYTFNLLLLTFPDSSLY